MSMAAGALGLLGAAAGRAQAQSVAISVDATAPGAPIPHIWDFHGFDEVNYSTSAEGRALLNTLGQIDPTPPHIRMHFLLNTGDGTPALKWGSTNVYTEDAAGNPVYSWTITDQIMDAVTGAGGLSFTEIAFMPQALSPHPTPYQNSSTYASDSGSFYPPSDYANWGDLISTWARHLNSRYPNVAQSWLWELWNEPDLSYFHGTAAEYEKLYDYTEAALHQVIPTAKLGGPAVASSGSSLLSSFLQHCANGTNAVTGKTGTRLDLVSFHAKGGATIVNGHVEMNMGQQLSLHRTGFSAVAAVPAFKQLPIYVSEADPDGCAACPVSSTPADAYRLYPAYGAYVIEMSKRTLDLASSMGVNIAGLITWAFTFPGTPYFAGYRALGTNGIELPVLGAFRLLGGLNGARLPVTSSGAATLASILANSVRGAADVDGMATLDGDKVEILVWNYHDDLVTATPATVNLTVKMPASFGPTVSMTHLRVDEQHGDAYTVWTSQGSPNTPSAVQIQAMQAGMLPAALGAPQSLPVAGGTATISFALPRSGMSLLTLSSSAAAVDGGASGGAGLAGASGSTGAGGVGGSSPIGSGSGGGTASGVGGSGGGDGCSCAVGAGADGWAMVLAFALGSIAALARRGAGRARGHRWSKAWPNNLFQRGGQPQSQLPEQGTNVPALIPMVADAPLRPGDEAVTVTVPAPVA
jgi:xylan 1,4-beta-xylosidase